jgi:opacity protein-like surface antigen
MLKRLSVLTAITCFLATGSAFAADPSPNYVKLIGKYTRMSDMDITDRVQVDSDEGYGFGAAIGRHFGMFKVEAEVATQESDINNFEVNERGGRSFETADARIDTLMLNGYVDVPVAGDFWVYGGGGIGGAAVTVSARDYDADETVFAYKLMAGVSYYFSDQFGTELGYEYLATEDVSYNLIEVEDISSSNLVLAFKYMF